MPRPRGSRSTPDTVVYHRTCFRFDTGIAAEKEALAMLKNPATKPSGMEAAHGAILFVALKEVLSPIIFQRLMTLAADFFASDAEVRANHPFISYVHNLGIQTGCTVPIYSMPFAPPAPSDIQETSAYRPHTVAESTSPALNSKKKKGSSTTEQVSAPKREETTTSTDEKKKEPSMDDGYDDMDAADLSEIFMMSKSFMEQ